MLEKQHLGSINVFWKKKKKEFIKLYPAKKQLILDELKKLRNSAVYVVKEIEELMKEMERLK
tara:strand:+ start:4364 stop:4549 length:186 start_codon:yes stop_codon:yes gene_type:complete